MEKSVAYSVHMDKETKKQCEKIFGELGMTLSGAIHIFMRRSVHAGGFPFDVRIDKSTMEKLMGELDGTKTAEEKQKTKSPKRKHEPA